jgi:hypothetical protein
MSDSYLTQKDVDEYGNEMLDVSQRAAMQAVAPYLRHLNQQHADLQARQVRDARRALDEKVAQLVPNYRDFDRDSRWHQWLLGIDLMSGRMRQTLLNEAINSGNVSRVVAFFKQFTALPASSFQSNGAFIGDRSTGTSSRTTSRRSSNEKPTYDNAAIARIYERRRKGLISDDRWPAIEQDIFAAQREGRVAARPFFSK